MKYIPNGVSRPVFRAVLVLKKNSPNIMFAGGIGGVLAGTVLACRATLKLSEALPEMKDDLDAARTLSDPNEKKKAVASVYAVNTGRVVKMYAPAVVVTGASIGALTGSHVTLTRRNAGLTAAYAAVQKAYDDYRERVKNDLGEEKELDIYHSAKTDVIEDENGKKVAVKTVDPNTFSPYAVFFDKSSTEWQKNPELNKVFILCQQKFANDLLRAQGHVTLNDVYDSLRLPRTKAGFVVGWVLNDDGSGDNYIDFGVFEARNADFVNGYETSPLLDFNVDGVIYDKIEKRK